MRTCDVELLNRVADQLPAARCGIIVVGLNHDFVKSRPTKEEMLQTKELATLKQFCQLATASFHLIPREVGENQLTQEATRRLYNFVVTPRVTPTELQIPSKSVKADGPSIKQDGIVSYCSSVLEVHFPVFYYSCRVRLYLSRR